MKIMLFHVGAMIDEKRGGEKIFCHMANEFSRRGHTVLAVAFDEKKGMPGFYLSPDVKFINMGENIKNELSFWNRIRAGCILDKNKRHIYRNNKIDVVIKNKLDQLLTNETPDIIISFNPKATRIVRKSKGNTSPLISMLHISPKACFTTLDEETRRYLEASDCIQVLMPSFKKELRKYVDNNNIVVIGNVIMPVNFICDYKSKRIINIASFSKEKRQDLLIKAFAKVSSGYKDWEMDFYGGLTTKGYFEYCQRLVKELSLDNVFFCGVTDDVYGKLKQCSIFVLPSEAEGFPLALTEAMSVGLPCIGFKDAPSVNELIKDGRTGILCDDGVDALAEALKELMNDEEKRKRYGQNGKEIVPQYAPEIIWDEWEKLIIKTVTDFHSNK